MSASDRPALCLYDDARARLFEPFATTRPGGELRAGALLVRERWTRVLGGVASAFAASPALDGFAEFDAPPSVSRAGLTHLAAGTVVVHTRALPFLAGALMQDPDIPSDVLAIDGRVAAVRLAVPLDLASLRDGTLSLEALAISHAPVQAVTAIDGVWLDEVWDIIRLLNTLLVHDIPALAAALDCTALDDDGQQARGPVVIGGHPVWLESGATIEPYAVFDTTLGPVLLRRGASVQAFTRVVGPCYVGCDAAVMADRISGSAIGDTCRVHGELSATVLIGHANKGHDGFVGHSIIGRWVNLGAGTTTSNLKNTYGTVALWTTDGIRDTGLQFLGTLFGDHAKTGIGMRLTTGCVLGAGANVMDAMPPKAVAPFTWGTRAPYDVFALDKFLQTAERMMTRRQVVLDDAQRAHLGAVHRRAVVDTRWPAR